MHVFVTGGSGLIGTPLVAQLIEAGHTVSALARSDSTASKLSSRGATPILGSHKDLEVLGKAAAEADATIHLAFNHDLISQGADGLIQACKEDREAISAICDAMVASSNPKTFIYSSNTGDIEGEDEKCGKRSNTFYPRYLSDEVTHSYADKGVRTVVMRLPPIVHGPGYEHTFVTTQIQVAKQNGVAGYIGDGSQLWPSVHAKDAAALYVLALTKGPSEANLHVVQEEGIPIKSIAEFVAKRLGGLETKSYSTVQEAMEAGYGFVGMIMSRSCRATAVYTKEWTGWEPKEYGLFKELEGYTY